MTENFKFKQNNFKIKSPMLDSYSDNKTDDNKDYFEPTSSFIIVVPNDYDHDIQIDKFIKRALSNAYEYDTNLNSLNFSKASYKLKPNEIYHCVFYKIIKSVSSEKCLSFLKSQNAVLVGGQGLSLICQLKSRSFPDDRFVISLDEKKYLWQAPQGQYMVPCFCIEQMYDPDNYFVLHSFNDLVPTNYYLLCVTCATNK